jgi:hypothetical protein
MMRGRKNTQAGCRTDLGPGDGGRAKPSPLRRAQRARQHHNLRCCSAGRRPRADRATDRLVIREVVEAKGARSTAPSPTGTGCDDSGKMPERRSAQGRGGGELLEGASGGVEGV